MSIACPRRARSAPSPRGRERPLHVALNLVFLNERSGGVGRYARELVPALMRAEPGIRILAFASRELPADVLGAPWAGEVQWIRLPVRTSEGPPGTFALATAAQWLALPALASRRGVDLVHGLANVAPLWMPGAARVVTLLDLIWLHFPAALEPPALVAMRRVALPSARRADRVIAISHAARADMLDTLGLRPDRVDVAPLGVAPEPEVAPTPEPRLREQLRIAPTAAVVATVSAGREHKNLRRLVGAFTRLPSGAGVLVIAGDVSREQDELRAIAARAGAEDRVLFSGWLPAPDLEGLYRSATCWVVPSLMEGFGLPVLEAMQRGVPVACSRAGALAEVAGEAAELFDPYSETELAASLRRLLESPERRAELVRLGRERCSRYTWQATAEATLASYRRATRERRS